MEILIVFAKEKISSLSGNRDDFSNEIIKIGKTLSSESKNEDVHIQIVDGAVPDISDEIKIVVYISSENLKNNMGALIVEFKRCLLKIFDNYGLPLTRKEIEVRANPSFSIEKFIEQIIKAANTADKNFFRNTTILLPIYFFLIYQAEIKISIKIFSKKFFRAYWKILKGFWFLNR